MKVTLDVTDLNDNRPMFYPLRYYAVVPETAGVGYPVISVQASDADSGDNSVVRYSLSQQSGAQGRFSIHPQTGEISVSGSLPASVRSYSVQVCPGLLFITFSSLRLMTTQNSQTFLTITS